MQSEVAIVLAIGSFQEFIMVGELCCSKEYVAHSLDVQVQRGTAILSQDGNDSQMLGRGMEAHGFHVKTDVDETMQVKTGIATVDVLVKQLRLSDCDKFNARSTHHLVVVYKMCSGELYEFVNVNLSDFFKIRNCHMKVIGLEDDNAHSPGGNSRTDMVNVMLESWRSARWHGSSRTWFNWVDRISKDEGWDMFVFHLVAAGVIHNGAWEFTVAELHMIAGYNIVLRGLVRCYVDLDFEARIELDGVTECDGLSVLLNVIASADEGSTQIEMPYECCDGVLTNKGCYGLISSYDAKRIGTFVYGTVEVSKEMLTFIAFVVRS